MSHDACPCCGAGYGTIGVTPCGPRQQKALCSTCVEREGVEILVTPQAPSINDLSMDAICGNCGRPRRDHLPRADWQCPSHGLYFNEPTPLIKRIAEAAGFELSNQLWMSDLEGLVKRVTALCTVARQLEEFIGRPSMHVEDHG